MMQDRIYLLDLEELTAGRQNLSLFQRAGEFVDGKRLEKVMRIRNEAGQAASLGAGLLIQKAVAERELPAAFFRRFGVTELLGELEQVGAPFSLSYEYGKEGKPYLKDIPMQFNLSHSGRFVLCAASEAEIGADIQQMRDLEKFKVAERYFSPAERERILQCAEHEARVRTFYELWTRKEAYGKLTGEGIATAVELDTETLNGKVEWLACEAPEGYQIAVCKKKENKDEGSRE